MGFLTEIKYFEIPISVSLESCLREALKISEKTGCICKFKFNYVDMEVRYNKYINSTLKEQINDYVEYYRSRL